MTHRGVLAGQGPVSVSLGDEVGSMVDSQAPHCRANFLALRIAPNSLLQRLFVTIGRLLPLESPRKM